MGLSALRIFGGIAQGLNEADAAVSKRNHEINLKKEELRVKNANERAKTAHTAASKKYQEDVDLIAKINRFKDGIASPQGQVLAGGYKNIAEFKKALEMGASYVRMPELGERPLLNQVEFDAEKVKKGGGNLGELFKDIVSPVYDFETKEPVPVSDTSQTVPSSTYTPATSKELTDKQMATLAALNFGDDDVSTKFKEHRELVNNYTKNTENHKGLLTHLQQFPKDEWAGIIKAIATDVIYNQATSTDTMFNKTTQAIFARDESLQDTSVGSTPSESSLVPTGAKGSQLSVLENAVLQQEAIINARPVIINKVTQAKKDLVVAQKALLKFKETLLKNDQKISDKFSKLEDAQSRDQAKLVKQSTREASSALKGDYFYIKAGKQGKKKWTSTELGKAYEFSLTNAINYSADQLRDAARADEILDIEKLDAIDWTNAFNRALSDMASRTFPIEYSNADSVFTIPYNIVPFGTKITKEMQESYKEGLIKYIEGDSSFLFKDRSLGDLSAEYSVLQRQKGSTTDGGIVPTPLSDGDVPVIADGLTPTLMSDGTVTTDGLTPTLMSDVTVPVVDMEIQFVIQDGIKGILGTQTSGKSKFLPFNDANKRKYELLGLGYLFKPEVGDIPRLNGDPRDNEWADPVVERSMLDNIGIFLDDAADEVVRALPGLPGGFAAKMPALITTYLRTGQVPLQLGIAGEKFGMLLDKLGITKHPMTQKIIKGKFGPKYGSRKIQVTDKIKGSTTGKVADAVKDRVVKSTSSRANRLKQRAATKARAIKNKVKSKAKNTGDSILNKSTGTAKPGYPINKPTKSRLDQFKKKTSEIK